MWSEAQLRDAIASNITVLGRDLTFLEKEKYIPPKYCTRSFIDLVARDSDGHTVLIELKRSAPASREAAHEILKYVEAVKEYLRLCDREIKVIIASTEWKELLIPFSRLVSECSSISITGIELKIVGNNINATIITPIKIQRGRFLAPWHDLFLYETDRNLDCGILTIEQFCHMNCIEDYIILVLTPHQMFNEKARAKYARVMADIYKKSGLPLDIEEINADKTKIPDYIGALYFAFQVFTEDAYVSILKSSNDDVEDVLDISNNSPEDDKIYHLHMAVSGLSPRPANDYYEIGYPAKLKCKLLDDEGWKVQRVLRYGAFSRADGFLSDDSIINELCGSEGDSRQYFHRLVSINNNAHVSSAKEAIRACLEDNVVWWQHISIVIDEISNKFPESEADIHIFNPCCGLLTLSMVANVSHDYVPKYSICVKYDGDISAIYYGNLVSNGNFSPSFEEVIKKIL